MSDEAPIDAADGSVDVTNEERTPLGPGLEMAFGYVERPDAGERRRGRSAGADPIEALRAWEPRTKLGRAVLRGEIITMEQALDSGLPIREVEIVDVLLPGLDDEVIKVNMVQRMTDSGRRVRFSVMAAVGNGDGFVGLGLGKGKEVAPTIRKAIDNAKLNIIQVLRGNGSWESGAGPGTSIPLTVTGKCGSTRVTLGPAPAGKGLVIGEVGRHVLRLAGVTDVFSRTKGQTRTTMNYATATFDALRQLNLVKMSSDQMERLHMLNGRLLA